MSPYTLAEVYSTKTSTSLMEIPEVSTGAVSEGSKLSQEEKNAAKSKHKTKDCTLFMTITHNYRLEV
jgi:hypothetical protein